GRFYTDEDLKQRAAVCLLGETVRQKLFPGRPAPVGETVRIDRLSVRVIGILAPKGVSPTGGDQDDQLFMPLTTLQHRIVGEEKVALILAAARSDALVEEARAKIAEVMRQRRPARNGPGAGFEVSTVQERAELALVIATTLQILAAAVAAISLLVGGVGVMNIMLVSVAERTR